MVAMVPISGPLPVGPIPGVIEPLGSADLMGYRPVPKIGICAMGERAHLTINGGAVQALGAVQNTGYGVFRHRKRIARTS
jgi:hypothetical protein